MPLADRAAAAAAHRKHKTDEASDFGGYIYDATCNGSVIRRHATLTLRSVRRATCDPQDATRNVRLAASSSQHATRKLQQTQRNAQHATRKVQHTSRIMHRAACNAQTATCNMHRATHSTKKKQHASCANMRPSIHLACRVRCRIDAERRPRHAMQCGA